MRYDVRGHCADIDGQLQDALQDTWAHERDFGQVKVQLVMDGGEVVAARANGISNRISHAVRHAVFHLRCGAQASAGQQIYRFRVDFINPDALPRSGDTQLAGARPAALRLALVSD